PLADLLTYVATATIWARVKRLAKEGMPPPPLVTCSATVLRSGASWSRFGPITPAAPAAASVWQLPQPAFAKTRAPALRSVFSRGGTGAAVVVGACALDFPLPLPLPQPAAAAITIAIAAAIVAREASRVIRSP